MSGWTEYVSCPCRVLTPVLHVPVWRVGPEMTEAEAIARAAREVRNGGVIIYPTETFYGLGGHPAQPAAIEKIYRIKGRERGKPLPLIAADAAVVRKVAASWPEEAEKLVRAFWPGPLTLIIPVEDFTLSATGSSERILLSPLVHSHTGKIAVRVSSHPMATALASEVGGFLISTSANFSGERPYRDPCRMPDALLDAVDGLLDAGRLPGRMPSTIVDVSSGSPRLVRPGCLSWEDVQSALKT